jgi:putative transposase
VSPAQRRAAAQFLIEQGLSQRRSCALVRLSRSLLRYQPQARDDDVVIERLRAIARAHKRYGYRRAAVLLRREQPINSKRVQRLWQQAKLQLPARRPKRRRTAQPARSPLQAAYPNHVWTYDFMEDATADGRKLRILTVVDEFTRECLAIVVARQFPSAAVIPVLARLFAARGRPACMRSDNGSEFIAHALCAWLYALAIDTYHIEPASPWQNPYGESFNGHFREECLNLEEFRSVLDAQVVVDRWRVHYNTQRPHSALQNRTPETFRRDWEATHPPAPNARLDRPASLALWAPSAGKNTNGQATRACPSDGGR